MAPLAMLLVFWASILQHRAVIIVSVLVLCLLAFALEVVYSKIRVFREHWAMLVPLILVGPTFGYPSCVLLSSACLVSEFWV